MIDKEVFPGSTSCKKSEVHRDIYVPKTIGHSRTQVSCRIVIGIYGNLAETAERTKIIQSSYMVIVLMSNQYSIYFSNEATLNICSRKSGPQSISITAPSVCNKEDARKRLSRGSAEVQTSHLQPISGTPVDVPLPNILSFTLITY